MKNKKIILAGGSGFIGQALAGYFGKEKEIVILGRQSGDTHKNSYAHKPLTAADGYNLRYVKWNGTAWASEIDDADLLKNALREIVSQLPRKNYRLF